MSRLKKKLKYYLKNIFSILFLLIISQKLFSNEIQIQIQGNNFTDDDVILSLIEDKPVVISESYSNYLLKTLDNSMLFENVSVNIEDNTYLISITEYPNINKIYFNKNERLKDEELLTYSQQLNLINLNPISINNYIDEIKNIYSTFGYNNIQINFSEKIFENTNTADLYFEINEGSITKIKNIYFEGNLSLDSFA